MVHFWHSSPKNYYFSNKITFFDKSTNYSNFDSDDDFHFDESNFDDNDNNNLDNSNDNNKSSLR